jgi:hypothetical protein
MEQFNITNADAFNESLVLFENQTKYLKTTTKYLEYRFDEEIGREVLSIGCEEILPLPKDEGKQISPSYLSRARSSIKDTFRCSCGATLFMAAKPLIEFCGIAKAAIKEKPVTAVKHGGEMVALHSKDYVSSNMEDFFGSTNLPFISGEVSPVLIRKTMDASHMASGLGLDIRISLETNILGTVGYDIVFTDDSGTLLCDVVTAKHKSVMDRSTAEVQRTLASTTAAKQIPETLERRNLLKNANEFLEVKDSFNYVLKESGLDKLSPRVAFEKEKFIMGYEKISPWELFWLISDFGAEDEFLTFEKKRSARVGVRRAEKIIADLAVKGRFQ